MFERGKEPLRSLRIGKNYTLSHFIEVHKERIAIKKAKAKADKKTDEYRLLLERERQNKNEQKEIYSELINQGIPISVLKQKALHPDK
jgi:hypothetical protein